MAIARSMRLFGLPYQFREEVDHRIGEFTSDNETYSINSTVGAAFTENFILEEPIITIIPGRPAYTNDTGTDKQTFTQALLDAAGNDFAPLKAILGDSTSNEIRYYDFQRAYTEYMQYVNVMCRCCATYLELSSANPGAKLDDNDNDISQTDFSLDGTSLTQYDWRNYRQDADSYEEVTKQVKFDAALEMETKAANGETAYFSNLDDEDNSTTITSNIYSFFDDAWTMVSDYTKPETVSTETTEEVEESETSDGTMSESDDAETIISEDAEEVEDIVEEETIVDEETEATVISYGETSTTIKYGTYTGESNISAEEMNWIETLLKDSSFVQFYTSRDVSISDGYSNNTADSAIKSALDTGSSFMKEVAFVMNSGGMSTEFLDSASDFLENTSEGLNSLISGSVSNSSGIGTMVSRILNVAGNVIAGENIIMPKIYQDSSTSRSLSFTVHLRAPYGNKFCYYMEILVPMMHLLALGIPKQSTANTYGSPFVVKAYVKGCQTVNLGMVTSIDITKGEDAASWSADGLPMEVDVKVDIEDLYGDLTMSSQNSPILFVNNSSLLEYLATVCGLDLSQPQVTAMAENLLNTSINSVTDIPSSVYGYAEDAVRTTISKLTNI